MLFVKERAIGFCNVFLFYGSVFVVCVFLVKINRFDVFNVIIRLVKFVFLARFDSFCQTRSSLHKLIGSFIGLHILNLQLYILKLI